MSRAVNVHGTAIVIGTTGLIFVGPSGSGKTAAALHCIGRAGAHGLFSALVADDQVLEVGDTYTLRLEDGRTGRLRVDELTPDGSGKVRALFVGEGSLG